MIDCTVGIPIDLLEQIVGCEFKSCMEKVSYPPTSLSSCLSRAEGREGTKESWTEVLVGMDKDWQS